MGKLKTPPKVRNFLWRATNNCLPTMTNLLSKRIEVNPICPVCGVENESTIHLLVSCQLSMQVWNKIGVCIQAGSRSSFFDWVTCCFREVDTGKHNLIATTCWCIWGARNKLVWNKKRTPVSSIISLAQDVLSQWICA